MPHLSHKSANIYYEVSGEGIPLLLLAGLGSDSASWAPLMPHIKDQFKIIKIDNRGCGQTSDNGASLEPADWVADSLAVLDHLKIEHFCVLGHSLGGMLALRLGLEAPDRVAAIIAMASANVPPAKTKRLIDDLVELQTQNVPDQLWLRLFFQFLFAADFFKDPNLVEAAIETSLAYPHRQSHTDFARQVDAINTMTPAPLEQLNIPVLSISGREDILIPHAQIESSLAKIEMLTTLQIEDAGHSLHWDQAEAVANAIKLFLSED